MDSEERDLNFREADRRYAELKHQFDAGNIGVGDFNAQRQRLMVQDEEGRWWARSPNDGEWSYYDGSAWVRSIPPGYQSPRTEPVESSPDSATQPTQDERLPSSQATLQVGAPVQDPTRRKKRRGMSRWGIVAAGFVVVAGLMWLGSLAIMNGTGAGPAPGYYLVEDDSKMLSAEIPTEWRERITSKSEGEKGKTWESYVGEDVISIAAANDLHSWRTGSEGHEGIYVAATKKLVQRYSEDELVALGPNDYSSSCEAGTRRDFNRPPYSGRMQLWENCGGESDHNALTLAAAPEGRECVVVLQIGGYIHPEEERFWHVLDTFDINCGGLA